MSGRFCTAEAPCVLSLSSLLFKVSFFFYSSLQIELLLLCGRPYDTLQIQKALYLPFKRRVRITVFSK